MEPIKGPAQRRQQLKSPFQSTPRSALFIILILQLQLIGLMSLADNDQASLSATSPKASVSSEQATTATTTKLESTQNEQPSAGGNPMGPRTDPGSEKSGTSPGVQAASSVPVPVTTTQDSLAGSMADADEGNVGAALAAASAKRTTVKKELAPTTEPTPSQADESSSSGDGSTRQPDTELQSQSQEQQPEQQSRQASPLASLLPSVNKQAGQLASMSPGLSGAISDIAEQLPSVYNRDGNYSTAGVNEDVAIQRLLPSNTNLFDKDAIDATQLGEMDCHLRNMDYCLAGLMGTAQKILPETNSELETRCDEMKATTSCLAVFNKRCSSFKILSVLAPYTQQSANLLAPSSTLLTDTQKEFVSSASSGLMSQPSVPLNGEPAVPSQMASLIPGAGRMVGSSASSSAPKASMSSLMEICEPHSKNTPENKELRKRLFQVAKCINARVPKLSPCLEDLKTAVQLFYEPRRVLPMRPTCCALARFRSCSMEAIDNVCGLSSFEQLMQSFSGQGSPVGMIKSIDRVCRQATDHRSAYCKEVLPPSGMKAPQRRGNKASKLAKALDLISFSPATQELG